MEIRVPLRDFAVTIEEVEEFVRKRTTDGMLIQELERRGFRVSRGMALEDNAGHGTPPAMKGEIEFNKWMKLRAELDHFRNVTPAGNAYGVILCLDMLVDLLQPPSVREARKSAALSQ